MATSASRSLNTHPRVFFVDVWIRKSEVPFHAR